MEKRVLFAGNPEQDILYVSHIFVEAAIEAGWYAMRLTSGVRAGVAHCTVAISHQPISNTSYAPPDIGVFFSLPAADRFEQTIMPNGLLVMNATAIRRPILRHDVDVALVPTTPEEEECDPTLSALILLGALIALTGWTSQEEMIGAVRRACSKGEACRALLRGMAFVRDIVDLSAYALI